jgi:hypothetical protein
MRITYILYHRRKQKARVFTLEQNRKISRFGGKTAFFRVGEGGKKLLKPLFCILIE